MTPRPPSAAPVARDPVSAAEPGKRWYAEHGLRIYRYLRYHVRSADEAEELTAETFLRAVRGAEGYDASRGSAKAWLFRIAQNVLRDARRRERRREWLPLGALRDWPGRPRPLRSGFCGKKRWQPCCGRLPDWATAIASW